MIPEFLAVSDKTELDLPNEIIWKVTTLLEDEVIVYITKKGEQQFITTHPFDDSKMYTVILFDYS